MAFINVRKGSVRPLRGLGDAVHVVALPVAKVLALDCVDPATGQLKPESGCAKRQAGLNDWFPFGKPDNS